MKRVGLTMTLALLVSLAMPVSSETNESYYHDEFRGGTGSWTDCGGVLREGEHGEWPEEHGHVTHERSYLVLEDDDDTAGGDAASRGFSPNTDATLGSFKAEAILQRDSNYTTPDGVQDTDDDPIALIFGLQACNDFYTLKITNDGASLWYVNATAGLQLATLSSDSPAYSEHLSIIEHDHLYTVTYDNETRGLKVFIDGSRMYSGDLDSIETALNVTLREPTGHMGLEVADNHRVYAQRARYLPLDTTGPEVDITRPEEGTAYIADNGVPNPAGGILVVGSLTIDVTLEDDILGVEHADLYIDGERIVSETHRYSGDLTIEDRWTIDTSGLAPGSHTVKIEAFDLDRNSAAATSLEFVVLPTVAETGSFRGLTGA